MANYSMSRLERLYLQEQADFGTIGGAPASTDACRFIRMGLNNETAVLMRPDKTGSRSQTVGIKGRAFARWNIEMSMHANGAAGTPPDCSPLLVGLFGKTPKRTGAPANPGVTAATKVTYELGDDIPFVTLWSYRSPSTLEQRVAHSCVVSEATFNLGQDVATWSCNGEGVWVLGDKFFGGADTYQKGGLGAFPAEPASQDYNGGIIAGFTGECKIAGTTIGVIRTATLRVQTQNQLIKDTFGNYYPTGTEGGERNVTISFGIYDDDTADVEAIKEASYTKTPVDINMQVGTVPGNIWTFKLKNVQLGAFNMNDNQLRFAADFGDSRAFTSTLTASDELILELT